MILDSLIIASYLVDFLARIHVEIVHLLLASMEAEKNLTIGGPLRLETQEFFLVLLFEPRSESILGSFDWLLEDDLLDKVERWKGHVGRVPLDLVDVDDNRVLLLLVGCFLVL